MVNGSATMCQPLKESLVIGYRLGGRLGFRTRENENEGNLDARTTRPDTRTIKSSNQGFAVQSHMQLLEADG